MAKIGQMLISAGNAMKPHLQTFWYYGKVELAPPRVSEIPLAIKRITNLVAAAKAGAWKNVTVKEAFLNALVTIEVCGWFYIGEVIGKRHIIGYKLT